MSFYPPKINEKFLHAKNVGRVEFENASATNASFVCGSQVRISLQIIEKSREINAAKFNAAGCGFLIAAAETVAERLCGKTIGEIEREFHKQSNAFANFVKQELSEIPENRKHCAELVFEALHTAIEDFRAAQTEEFSGEKALICTCFGVSEETIENLIRENSFFEVEDVTNACNAGGGCGSCQPLIEEIIDVARREHNLFNDSKTFLL